MGMGPLRPLVRKGCGMQEAPICLLHCRLLELGPRVIPVTTPLLVFSSGYILESVGDFPKLGMSRLHPQGC